MIEAAVAELTLTVPLGTSPYLTAVTLAMMSA
jgi:hypothetical protein